MGARELVKVLSGAPFHYKIERQRGSHRKLVSDQGYPPLFFSYHDGETVGDAVIRKYLVKTVGMDADEAIALVKGKR